MLEFRHHRGKEVVETIGTPLVADGSLRPFALHQDDAALLVDLAVPGTIHLEETPQAFGRGLHDGVGILEAAQLVVQGQEELLPALGRMHVLLGLFAGRHVLDDPHQANGFLALEDRASSDENASDAAIGPDHPMLDVEIGSRLEREDDGLIDPVQIAGMDELLELLVV